MSNSYHHAPSETVGQRRSNAAEEPADTDELLALLGDEYTRNILSTLGDESLPAREIANRSEISRATVYRRINRLEAVGVVEEVMSIHPEGQHRREFRIAHDHIELSLVDKAASDEVDLDSSKSKSESNQITHTLQ
ncbi:ArsR/SmtB family transcription factor [Haloarcula sediminis]|uniref:ArsR/SmtB family transcription factor n=1 Tax=Haloarcula sediminis TaxID=3111777 RepID=UPI002D785ACF|nr:winged helix-turn-helix domain-containing protein [Haloarcula sp. CK38]